jgi:RHS repeat-associated protein
MVFLVCGALFATASAAQASFPPTPATTSSFTQLGSVMPSSAALSETKARPGRLTSVKVGWSADGGNAKPIGSRAIRAALSAPTVPFTECPAVGDDTGCGLLIDVTDSGIGILQDPSQGPYDGSDDTLVGVLNQSNKTIGHLALGSGTDIFGFDGDGLCVYGVIGCPFGPTGYEGPGTSFVEISPGFNSGVVSFSSGVAPGGTAYFSLEAPLDASSVVSGGPSLTEQGGAPNGSEHRTTCGAGDPVNCATGALWHTFTDASIPGLGVPLKFTRTYNSLDAETDGPLGFGWTDSYNMSLSVNSETGAVTVHEEDGSQTTFVSNGIGGFKAPPRVLATLVQNGDSTFTFSRFTEHIQYIFSEAGQLVREVDRNGNTTTLTYAGGQLERVTDPSGRSLTFAYAGSHIHTITDPMGRIITFNYDSSGNLVGTADTLGRVWGFTYDADHLLLSMTDPHGGTTTNTYDSSGRVTAQVDPANRTMTWSYTGNPVSSEGGTTTLTDARGNITVYDYENLELVALTHGVGTSSEATTTYNYDPATLGVTVVTDPDGNVTHNAYDGHGNLSSTTDPLGRTTYFLYDSLDDPIYVFDPREIVTRYSYDGVGNLLEKTTGVTEVGGNGQTTTYGYEAAPGEVTTVTDPNGHTTTYTYDKAGDRTNVTDADGHTTTFTYNSDGELTGKVSPTGNVSGGDPTAHTITYAYNAGGELTSETDPLGHTTSYAYDENGNRTSVIDANGHTTRQTYDANNELTEVARPDGSTLKTQWDAAGNMVSQIDGAGKATVYTYDPLNRLASTTDPDNHTTSYAYDPAGRKTESTNAEGQITHYGYDLAGELTSISYSDGQTPNVSESYDQDGNRIGLTDGSGTSSFTYNALNQMISATDGSGATVHYGYDLAGQLTSLTYPNNQNVTREYDPAGNLTGVTDWLGHTSHFNYDPDANLNQEQYPNGVTTQLGYDNADRLTGITDTNSSHTLASFNYTRDPLGQVSSEAADNGTPTSTNYAYDTLDQLTSTNDVPYGYDMANNPTTFGTGTTQSFDPANELTSSTTAPSSESPEEKAKEEIANEGPGKTPIENPKEKLEVGPKASPIEPPAEPPHGGVKSLHEEKASSPTVDTMVSASAHTQGNELASPKLRTRSSHDLVLAFISASGPASGAQRVTRLSRDGLHWSLVARNARAGGTTEIWQAHARHRLSGRVTVWLKASGYPAALVVTAFGGSSPYIKNHATSHGQASSPAIQLGGANGALIWAVGHSTGQKAPTRPLAGQRLLAKFYDKPSHSGGWVQRATGSSASARIADANSSAQWQMAAVAIASHSARATRVSTARTSVPISSARGGTLTATGIRPSASVIRSATSGSEGVTRHYTYNARGDRIGESATDGTTLALGYDQADRLVGVGSTIAYAYNGDGLRVSKTVGGVTTQFVWNQAEAMPELLQDGSTYYIYGPEGRPIEQVSAETPTYLHQDQQGSTRLLTDSEGNVVGRYNYDSWGTVTSHTGSATTSLQYDGQYTDTETGFQYLRARYYDPSTGQFLTQDPIFAITGSRYGYTRNDPLNASDPLGSFSISNAIGQAWIDIGAYHYFVTHTVGGCISGSGSVTHVYGSVSVCAEVTGGNDALSASGTTGASTSALSGSVGISPIISDQVVTHSGWDYSATQGGSGGAGWAGGGDISEGRDPCGQVTYTFQPFIGLGGGIEFHTGLTYTYTKLIHNIL